MPRHRPQGRDGRGSPPRACFQHALGATYMRLISAGVGQPAPSKSLLIDAADRPRTRPLDRRDARRRRHPCPATPRPVRAGSGCRRGSSYLTGELGVHTGRSRSSVAGSSSEVALDDGTGAGGPAQTGTHMVKRRACSKYSERGTFRVVDGRDSHQPWIHHSTTPVLPARKPLAPPRQEHRRAGCRTRTP